MSAAAPCGSARKTASAPGTVASTWSPVWSRWMWVPPIGSLVRPRPTSPSIRTFGWRESNRTSSAPTYPVAPTMTTRIRGPGDDERPPAGPPRGRDTARRPGTAATTGPPVSLTGARPLTGGSPAIVVVAGVRRPAVVCMTRMTIHRCCIVMQTPQADACHVRPPQREGGAREARTSSSSAITVSQRMPAMASLGSGVRPPLPRPQRAQHRSSRPGLPTCSQLPCVVYILEGGLGRAHSPGEASSGWPGFPTIPKVLNGRYRSHARPMRELTDTAPNTRESADTSR